jgi:hypothetical protein
MFMFAGCFVLSGFCVVGNSAVKTKKKPRVKTKFTVQPTNFWQYFSLTDEVNAYRLDSITAKPLYGALPMTKTQRKRYLQDLSRKKLLERKSQTTGLSTEFLNTQRDRDLSRISMADINKSIREMNARKRKKPKSPIFKKTVRPKYSKIGPYYDSDDKPVPVVKEPAAAKTQSDFYLD